MIRFCELKTGFGVKMNSIIKLCCFFWTLVYLLVVTKAEYQCGIRKHSFVPLVYHGWKVEEGQWPWHVALYHKSENGSAYACGGSLIGQKHVVTAAHCVATRNTRNPMPVENILLHLGQTDLSTVAKHVQVRDVELIHVHPEYSRYRNDIAVLELRLPVEFTDFVIPICMDTRVDKDLRNLEGLRGWITGWGLTQNKTVSSNLRSASLPVVSYLQCFQNDRTLFGSLLNQNVFCAGDRNGTSPGTGDSGGGMYFSEGDRWVLRGIVSFAKIDESRLRVDTSKYAVFVNVQRFLSWIREVTEDRNSTAGGGIKRISEQECDRFKSLVMKRSNGICSNARHPHTVSLVYLEELDHCTGILINEKHVLTACHCTSYGKYNPSMVRIGEFGAVNISSIVCHPAFKRASYHHDLAIVKLKSPVDLAHNVIPACLANNQTENLYDTLLTTGFRHDFYTDLGEFFESDANQVIPEAKCNRDNRISSFYGFQPEGILPAQLCVANNDQILSSMYYASSGAPLQTVNTRTCLFTVVGVLNHGFRDHPVFGDQTENGTTLEVFSRVAYYLDWIEDTVWGEKSVPETTTKVSEEPITNKLSLTNNFVFPAD